MSDGGGDQGDHLGRATEAALWDALWQRRTRLVATARRRGLSLPDAEDAASEAIVRAAAYADLDHERLDEFLVTALRRIVVDDLRRKCHLRDRLALLSRDYGAETTNEDEGEGEVVSRLTLRTLLSHARLSKLERDILKLRMIGLQHAEIAHSLRISRHASELGLARCRRKVRTALTRTMTAVLVAWPGGSAFEPAAWPT